VRQPDYYELLGVAPDCSHDAIHARFRDIIRQLSSNPASATSFPPLARLNEAFRTLGDPVERVHYDRARQPDQPPPPDTPPEVPLPAPHDPAQCPFCETIVAGDVIVGPDTTCHACEAPLYPASRQSSLDDSRRMLDRLPFNMRVTFERSSAPGMILKGITDDVSLGGMRLHTPGGLEVGERIMLDCDFCVAVASVRYVQPGDEDTLSVCGLQFVTVRLKHQRGGLLSTTA
jgi:hypothetical protein